MPKKYKYEVSYRASLGKGSDGKYHYKRFTGHSNTSEHKALEDAKRQAERWKVLHEEDNAPAAMTLKQACESYIASKDNVLSPSTVRGYWIIVRNRLPELMGCRVSDLTQAQIQFAINEEAKRYSPKTVHNDHGFLAAVLAMFRPSLVLHTRLPEKQQKAPHVPSNEEIETLMHSIEQSDTELYKALLLAAFGSLRRSEICALTSEDITGNVVRVCKAMVPNKKNEYVVKDTTKSEAGTRLVMMPEDVAALLVPSKGEKHIVSRSPHQISQQFSIEVKRAGLEHFRFHDLRHYQASILHAMGVPDQYIMARGGWKTDATLKTVYRHQMDDKRQQVEDDICKFFSDRFQL